MVPLDITVTRRVFPGKSPIAYALGYREVCRGLHGIRLLHSQSVLGRDGMSSYAEENLRSTSFFVYVSAVLLSCTMLTTWSKSSSDNLCRLSANFSMSIFG